MLIFICVTLWHSNESNFTVIDQDTFLYNKFESCILKITASFLRGQWVNSLPYSTSGLLLVYWSVFMSVPLLNSTSTAPSHCLNQCWFSFVRFCYIHLSTISQWLTKTLFCIISLKIAFLKLPPHLSGANELTVLPYSTSVAFYQRIDPCSCQCHYLIPLQSSFTFSLISWFIDFDGNHLKVSNAIAKKRYNPLLPKCVYFDIFLCKRNATFVCQLRFLHQSFLCPNTSK